MLVSSCVLEDRCIIWFPFLVTEETDLFRKGEVPSKLAPVLAAMLD